MRSLPLYVKVMCPFLLKYLPIKPIPHQMAPNHITGKSIAAQKFLPKSCL